MDGNELRAMQAPIKQRYKDDPNAAVITLKAKGMLDDANIACKVETGRALAVAGTGRRDSGGSSVRRRVHRCFVSRSFGEEIRLRKMLQ